MMVKLQIVDHDGLGSRKLLALCALRTLTAFNKGRREEYIMR